MTTELALWMWMGMVFNLKGAATEKTLSLAHLLLLGTWRLKPWSVCVLTEPSHGLLTVRHAPMYQGQSPFSDL